MKLINDELQKRFNKVGRQKKNPLVIAKFFDPVGSGTWYATEYDPETNICYGYVTGLAYDEWGYFSIDELESLKRPFGLTIERDLYFSEIPFNDLLTKINNS
jgi:glucose dehydrogenase